jgi:hypothetical protein
MEKIIRSLLNAGANQAMNRSTKMVLRDDAKTYAVAQIAQQSNLLMQVMAVAWKKWIDRIESNWLSGNLYRIRQSIETANLKVQVSALTPPQVGALGRAIVKKHGDKWLLVAGPLKGEDKKRWFYLKRFKDIKPSEWQEMIDWRDDRIDKDTESRDDMEVLDTAARKANSSLYMQDATFEAIF